MFKKLFIMVLLFSFGMSSYAMEHRKNHCELTYINWLPNIFGNYTIKKKVYIDQYHSSFAECREVAHQMIVRYHNVQTKWSEIELSYIDSNSVRTDEIIEKK